jgi:hypothetical protein
VGGRGGGGSFTGRSGVLRACVPLPGPRPFPWSARPPPPFPHVPCPHVYSHLQPRRICGDVQRGKASKGPTPEGFLVPPTFKPAAAHAITQRRGRSRLQVHKRRLSPRGNGGSSCGLPAAPPSTRAGLGFGSQGPKAPFGSCLALLPPAPRLPLAEDGRTAQQPLH